MRHGTQTSSPAAQWLDYFEPRRAQIITTIRQLVEIESPSDDKAGLDRVAAMLCDRFSRLGGRVKLHRQKHAGDHVQADFGPSNGQRILLLGHHDTVYPLGTLRHMPCKISKGKLFGPGSFDMKAGLGFMIELMAAFAEPSSAHGRLPRPVTVLSVSDEEIGSRTSRNITEAIARKCAAVFVLEPALGNGGAVKTARKGVGEFKLRVIGRSAHAGLEPEKGANAVHELARQLTRITGFAEPARGLTVSAGLIRGGTRVNVVPAEAEADIDVRIVRLKDAAVVEKRFRSLRPFDNGCQLELTGGLNRPPLERTASVQALYRTAAGLAAQMGWQLDEAMVGGGSDGNFTGALGIPTLDGLGAVGEGAHAPHESVQIEALPRRLALLARLIEVV